MKCIFSGNTAIMWHKLLSCSMISFYLFQLLIAGMDTGGHHNPLMEVFSTFFSFFVSICSCNEFSGKMLFGQEFRRSENIANRSRKGTSVLKFKFSMLL